MKLFLMIFLLIPFFSSAQTNRPKTPQEVVNLIKKNVTCDWAEQTVDNLKPAIRKHL